MAVGAKNVVESLREVVQDLLVPEFKALKVSVDALRGDMQDLRYGLKESADVLRGDMQDLRSSLKESVDSLRTEMKLRDERQDQSMRYLAERLDFAIDIRERIASLEARIPRQ